MTRRNIFNYILCLGLFLTSINIYSQVDTVSYSLGVIVAQNLVKQGISGVNADGIAKGLSDVLNGNELAVNAQDADRIFSTFVQEQQAKMHEVNKSAGESFLAENMKRKEVVTTDSGLQYEVITEGSGEKPAASSTVNVHYHGTTIDGNVFDSSVERGQPISFPLQNVIKGWTEGLQYMTVGSKYRFFIPQDLAYGAQSPSPAIQPFSTLIFEVELLGIE